MRKVSVFVEDGYSHQIIDVTERIFLIELTHNVPFIEIKNMLKSAHGLIKLASRAWGIKFLSFPTERAPLEHSSKLKEN
jgi:hypothetical protein